MGRRISRVNLSLKLKVKSLACTLTLLAATNVILPQKLHATAVFDAHSFARMGEVLSQGAQQLSRLQTLTGEVSHLNAIMGNHLPSKVTSGLDKLSGQSGEFGGLLHGISSPYADSLSSMNAFASSKGAPDFSNILYAKDFIKGKLFPEGEPKSMEESEQIREERNHVVKESSINSVALASQQKNAIRNAHQRVEDLGQKAIESPTIHDDLRATNQLLAVIASEMIQQRAILAQHLELNAAVIAEQMPLVFKRTAASRGRIKESTSSTLKSLNF